MDGDDDESADVVCRVNAAHLPPHLCGGAQPRADEGRVVARCRASTGSGIERIAHARPTDRGS